VPRNPPGSEGLALSADNATALAAVLGAIDLTGRGPAAVPWGDAPSLDAFRAAIAAGAPVLPWAYRRAYLEPLAANVERVLAATLAAGDSEPAETLLGAVYSHAPSSATGAQLRRFNVVVAHFFRAFLGRRTRLRLNLSTIERLPPLATFHHDGARGPYTYPADAVTNIVGAEIAVVSLPSTYCDHPLIWAALSHETGGHDIVHAIPGLIADLGNVPPAVLPAVLPAWGVDAPTASLLAALWTYWMDEAAADVCATLNLGPAFVLNYIPLLAAFHAAPGGAPSLWTSTIAAPGAPLDSHPTDILRIGLAIGATGTLANLHPAYRDFYLALLAAVAQRFAGDAASVTLRGEIPAPGSGTIPLDLTLPLGLMQNVAALVGASIATALLPSLNGLSLQALETWDAFDDSAAWRVAAALKAKTDTALPSVSPAHLLAGATLALYDDPAAYADVTGAITAALDVCVARDRFWSVAPHPRSTLSSSSVVRDESARNATLMPRGVATTAAVPRAAASSAPPRTPSASPSPSPRHPDVGRAGDA